MNDIAVVTVKGVRRWESGHPWIYRSDVAERPEVAAGIVQVQDNRKRRLGWALWSPKSEISLRLLDSDPDATIDAAWWQACCWLRWCLPTRSCSIGRSAAEACAPTLYNVLYKSELSAIRMTFPTTRCAWP